MENNRFALLIDAENISAKYIVHILNEMTKYGVLTYRRIYGDWTNQQTSKWKTELLENSILPVQQFNNTVGKNASDSALIIDAMDILYGGKVDGFCIVSSDSDFTRLVSRLREEGMTVIGMGEKKTPRSFRAACNIFTSLELLLAADDDTQQDEKHDEKVKTKVKASVQPDPVAVSKSDIQNDIVAIISQNENNGKATYLGEIGSTLVNKYPDFDVRSYGYSLLSKFLGDFPSIELKKSSNIVTVQLRDNRKSEDEIIAFVRKTVASQPDISLGQLSNEIHLKYKGFSVKDFGFSTFLKFVQSIDGVNITNEKKNGHRVNLI